jgi:hypothetical protein
MDYLNFFIGAFEFIPKLIFKSFIFSSSRVLSCLAIEGKEERGSMVFVWPWDKGLRVVVLQPNLWAWLVRDDSGGSFV